MKSKEKDLLDIFLLQLFWSLNVFISPFHTRLNFSVMNLNLAFYEFFWLFLLFLIFVEEYKVNKRKCLKKKKISQLLQRNRLYTLYRGNSRSWDQEKSVRPDGSWNDKTWKILVSFWVPVFLFPNLGAPTLALSFSII